jgi:hypothetical protein
VYLPQRRVVSSYRVLLALPSTDDNGVVRLLADDGPKSINVEGIEIAFGCRRDTLGVRTRVDEMLLLPTDSEITRLELHYDSEPIVDGVSQR